MLKFLLVTAPWCTTCKPIKQAIEQNELADITIKDMEADFEELKAYPIRSVPTVLILDNSNPIGVIPCGNMSIDQLLDNIEEKIKGHLNAQ